MIPSDGVAKKRKRKKLGPIRRRRRREKIQSILILLIQVVCISLLFAHSIKKYAPDTMQCTHSFNTTISDVKRTYISPGTSVVFETCEGKVFINFDGGIGTHLAERIDATIKELRYLSDNNIEVSVRIRNEPEINPLSVHFKEYEMVALEDNQTQIDKFEKTQRLSLVIFCILLPLWLVLAVAHYVIFR